MENYFQVESAKVGLTVYTRASHPAEWALAQSNRAVALAETAELPGKDRCGGLRQAIACAKAALLVRTPEAFPHDHSITQNNLRIERAAYESAGCAADVPFDNIPPAD